MARVPRGLLHGLLHAGAWMLTTAAAVTLSWFGVHSVLRSTAYDPPRALPISGPASQPPVASSTHRPEPSPTGRASGGPAAPTHPASPSHTAPPPTSAAPPKPPPGTPRAPATASGDTGDVHGYDLAGGRVVLDLGADSASLVSATPDKDWQMQVWTEQGWLRVTFTSADGTSASSVFCTWNGHPPIVQAFEN
ncbi:hypothetical protein [Streptomyces sp. CA-111067]|uniref:hypothetical protein n=1 Tax=Streptomyces sp. CA-111067 TaxID=3240046 RepID=UPI003D96BB8E